MLCNVPSPPWTLKTCLHVAECKDGMEWETVPAKASGDGSCSSGVCVDLRSVFLPAEHAGVTVAGAGEGGPDPRDQEDHHDQGDTDQGAAG